MQWPLNVPADQRILPDAPGEFGAVRSTDVHTGVDLYCQLGTEVVAMEDGEVVGIEAFTGASVPDPDASPWWNDTVAILIKGDSGIILYGEVTPHTLWVFLGRKVKAGQVIGRIEAPVLKTNKGRPMLMLHLELLDRLPEGYTGVYRAPHGGISATSWWKSGAEKPAQCQDPTPLLLPLATGKFDLRTFDGVWAIDPTAPRKDSDWWSHWGGDWKTGRAGAPVLRG